MCPVADPPALAEQVARLRWYHTLELSPAVTTPGWFDLRPIATRVLPGSLEGKRCLDVGTFDGFWAFEMEKRKAAEVVAIDILDPRDWDWPANSSEEALALIGERKGTGAGFELARETLASTVDRRELSIYDLDSDRIGSFDFVYLGSLLLHLRDPVRGLQAVRSVCDGSLVVLDAIDPVKSWRYRRQPMARLHGAGRPWWWKPNMAGLVRMVEAAGFELTQRPERVLLRTGAGHPGRLTEPRLLLSRAGREELLISWVGDAHGLVVARPA